MDDKRGQPMADSRQSRMKAPAPAPRPETRRISAEKQTPPKPSPPPFSRQASQNALPPSRTVMTRTPDANPRESIPAGDAGSAARRPSPAPSAADPRASQAAAAARRAGEQPYPAYQLPGIPPEGTRRQPEPTRYPLQNHSDRLIDDVVDFVRDDEAEERRRTRRMIAILTTVIGAFICLSLLLFFVKQLNRKKDSDVRLQKQTLPLESSQAVVTTESLKLSISSLPTMTIPPTLPPLGTNPYENPPAWTPPTEATNMIMQYTYPMADPHSGGYVPAPPPVMTLPAVWTEAVPPQTEPEQPVVYPTAGEFTLPTAPPETAPPEENIPSIEAAVFNLPPLLPANLLPTPRKDVGDVVVGPATVTAITVDANGNNQIRVIEGSYSEVEASPDGSVMVALGYYGEVFLIREGQEVTPLDLSIQKLVSGSVANDGFKYLRDGMLYEYQFADAGGNVYDDAVNQALAASRSKDMLLFLADGTVAIQYSQGNRDILLEAGEARGNLKADFFAADGNLAVFQDDAMIYFYHRSGAAAQISRISKTVAGEAYSRYSYEGDEAVAYQEGASLIVRLNRDAVLEQIGLPVNLARDTKLIAAGNASEGLYSRLLILSGGQLFMSGMTEEDPVNHLYGSWSISSDALDAKAAGNAIFWTDSQGALRVASLDVPGTEAATQAEVISAGPVSRMMPLMDGSGIYYVMNGQLWRRMSGLPAERLSTDCKDFLISPDGNRCYLISNSGGLWRMDAAGLSNLVENGSGISIESLSLNPLLRRGANSWVSDDPLLWISAGTVYIED